MFLNFRTMKKGDLEIAALIPMEVTDTPLPAEKNFKCVDLTGHENLILTGEDEDGNVVHVVDQSYFMDGWTFKVAHCFNRAKYEKGEWPFDEVTEEQNDNLYEYNAAMRRKDIGKVMSENLSKDTELKYLREAVIALCNHVGMSVPKPIEDLTNTIEHVKKNFPKDPNWKPASELLNK